MHGTSSSLPTNIQLSLRKWRERKGRKYIWSESWLLPIFVEKKNVSTDTKKKKKQPIDSQYNKHKESHDLKYDF